MSRTSGELKRSLAAGGALILAILAMMARLAIAQFDAQGVDKVLELSEVAPSFLTSNAQNASNANALLIPAQITGLTERRFLIASQVRCLAKVRVRQGEYA